MHSRFRRFPVAGLLLLFGTLALLLSGCDITSGPVPESQQILRLPLFAGGAVDLTSIDPAQIGSTGSYIVAGLVFPGMLTLSAAGTPMPWAAQAMPTFDATANTYTFKIRSGLRWSDGTPIDANTFAYSINRTLSPCIGSPVNYYLFAIKDAEDYSTQNCGSDGTTSKGKIQSLIGDSLNVPDSQTLVITLVAAAPYFLEVLSLPITFAQPE